MWKTENTLNLETPKARLSKPLLSVTTIQVGTLRLQADVRSERQHRNANVFAAILVDVIHLVALPPFALNSHPFSNNFASVANILRPFSNNLQRALPIVATNLSPSRPMIAISVLCLQDLNRMFAGRYN